MTCLLFPRLNKSLVPALLLACLGFNPMSAHSAEAEKRVDPAAVEIHVEHGVSMPWGKPGFRVEIAGWQPHGELSMYAIAPDGSQIALIPKEKPVHVDESGEFSVDIDYQRKGLGPGHWMFLVAGKPGIHEFETDLPQIEPPSAGNPKWRLIFGKGKGKSM